MEFLEKKMAEASLASELDTTVADSTEKPAADQPSAEATEDPTISVTVTAAAVSTAKSPLSEIDAVDATVQTLAQVPIPAVSETTTETTAVATAPLPTTPAKAKAIPALPDTGVIVLTVGLPYLAGSALLLNNATELALDCEGVDLGRLGKTCIVQLSTRTRCFLFDVHGATATDDIVVSLKTILESAHSIKVIHDCRQDADALLHHFGIRLVNVHDTQCWDKVLKSQERNLNKTLMAYGVAANVVRDCSVYKVNPAFWASRPLTPRMIEWATGDVTSLFELYDLQRAAASGVQATRATDRSTAAATELPTWVVKTDFLSPYKMRKFIGTGGCNIKALEARIPGIHMNSGNRPGEMTFYAKNEATMLRLMQEIKPFK